MSQLPSVTGKKVIAVLEKIGFKVARVRGSHHILIYNFSHIFLIGYKNKMQVLG